MIQRYIRQMMARDLLTGDPLLTIETIHTVMDLERREQREVLVSWTLTLPMFYGCLLPRARTKDDIQSYVRCL